METFLLTAGVVVVLVGAIVLLVVLRRPRPTSVPPEIVVTDDDVTRVAIEGDQVVVDFDVTMPPGGDAHLADVLARAAVDVVRRRSIDLDLGSGRVTSVVARSGGVDAPTVGRVPMAGGRLPEPHEIRVEVVEATGADPLLDRGVTGGASVAAPGVDELPPVGAELDLPAEVEASLRAAGIDPAAADAGELVDAVLRHGGWSVEPKGDGTHLAVRGGRRLLVRVIPHDSGDHPELADEEVSRFVVELAGHSGAEGILVTGKIVPFHLVAKQRKGLRVVGRQRLGALVDEFLSD